MAFLCCAAFAVLVIRHAAVSSGTYDEISHVAAGYSYWRWHDYRIGAQNPPVAKLIATLPLLGERVWPAEIEPTPMDPAREAPPTALVLLRHAWTISLDKMSAQWVFGSALLYGIRDETLRRFGVDRPFLVPTTATLDSGDFYNDADALLFRARMAIMSLGLLLALLVFAWARELHGPAGAALAVALYSFDPNFIAHSGLATVDVGVALFMFGAVYFLWRTCQRIRAASLALMLACFGLALTTKHSAILLAPVFTLLLLGRAVAGGEWPVGAARRVKLGTRRARLWAASLLLVATALAAYAIVWAVHGFRYSAARDPAAAAAAERALASSAHHFRALEPAGSELAEGSERPEWRRPGHLPIERSVRREAAVRLLQRRGPTRASASEIEEAMAHAPLSPSSRLILFLERHRLLPEAYLYGVAVIGGAWSLGAGDRSFLRGDFARRGFRSYFLWTFLLKTPLVTILAIAAALAMVVWRRELRRSSLAFLLLPVGLYLLVAILSSLNIGHRHLLPVYPFLYVLCGRLGPEWARLGDVARRWTAGAALGAIALGAFVVFAPAGRPTVVYPHYLAYFNELGGGPSNGYRNLVDSNLDWGQDLKTLREWLDRNRIDEPFYLCYFGLADPRYYQVPHTSIPGCYWGVEHQQPLTLIRPPAYVAISATHLQRIRSARRPSESWQKIFESATLVDMVGYSILIYRLAPASN
jgi:4-amino-4-deoxy-L-arabinose transferase-like glycosyltransferase